LFEVKSRRGTRVLAFLSPILSEGVLDELYSTLESLAAESGGGPLVLCSAHPSVFLAGAHLAEIAVLDAESSAPYARRGRRVIERLEDYPAPTVAAINGSCSGGGFDLALACDALITGPNLHLEVRRLKRRCSKPAILTPTRSRPMERFSGSPKIPSEPRSKLPGGLPR
jgi:hypothetical protein